MSTENRPPITCHVLDTTIGKPGASILTRLTLLNATDITPSSSNLVYKAETNSDGRVTAWTTQASSNDKSIPIEKAFSFDGDQRWNLTFYTEDYFNSRGIKPFFTNVEVNFIVRADQKNEHFHVPVLLGPFGYTTYRGS